MRVLMDVDLVTCRAILVVVMLFTCNVRSERVERAGNVK